MLVLFETAAGYAVFKLLKEKKLKKVEQLYEEFQSPEGANNLLKLTHFKQFKDSTEAVAAGIATIEGKMSKPLKKLLKKLVVGEMHEELAVADAKLANCIKEKFNLNCLANSSIQELMRCIRSQSDSLLSGLSKKEMAAWELSLAHSLSRYKLKFSPDKVDTMIVQAIGLLDDVDKELNNYVMRIKEWYGWHFPELGKAIDDNLALVKTIQKIGFRTNAVDTDLSEILPEEKESQVKREAEMSMGVDISEADLSQINAFCEEVIELTETRAQLYDYLRNRMMVIAPNLTLLVGELVGARLVAHAGSLLNLAKHPASTVQILGAEKALFRALKTKHDTPKYGIIYHASLVGQCSPKFKGKMSRTLAAKVTLAIRVDALSEDAQSTATDLAINAKAKLERMLKSMDDDNRQKLTGSGKRKAQFDKYENKSVVKTHPQTDSTLPKKRKLESGETPPAKKIKVEEEGASGDAGDKLKKKKKHKKTEEGKDADQ